MNNNALFFSLTKEVRRTYQPKRKQIKDWLVSSLIQNYQNISLNISIVSIQKSQQFNLAYRNKDKPTNVISLEYPNLKTINASVLIGDIILCDEVILEEANTQNKSIIEHYAHMVVHAMLHLQGMDHENDGDAEKMESLEVSILTKLGFINRINRK